MRASPIGAVVLDVGRADQREVALVRNREDDPLVGVLEDVGVVVVEQLRHDDVAALDQAQRLAARQVRRAPSRNSAAHGPGGVDERARARRSWRAAARRSRRTCQCVAAALRVDAARARQHRRAALGGVDARSARPAARRRPSRRNRRSPCVNSASAARRRDGCAGRPCASRAAPRAARGGRRGTGRCGSSTPAASTGRAASRSAAAT